MNSNGKAQASGEAIRHQALEQSVDNRASGLLRECFHRREYRRCISWRYDSSRFSLSLERGRMSDATPSGYIIHCHSSNSNRLVFPGSQRTKRDCTGKLVLDMERIIRCHRMKSPSCLRARQSRLHILTSCGGLHSGSPRQKKENEIMLIISRPLITVAFVVLGVWSLVLLAVLVSGV